MSHSGNLPGDAAIADLVVSFESGDLPPSEFGHRAHLLVALWYLKELALPEAEAHARMRANLRGYLARHAPDEDVYSETLTLFWIKRVARFVTAAPRARSLSELADELPAACGDPRLVFRYYSEELLASSGARTSWVEPDLRAFDF